MEKGPPRAGLFLFRAASRARPREFAATAALDTTLDATRAKTQENESQTQEHRQLRKRQDEAS
jgi:hypothetical protein